MKLTVELAKILFSYNELTGALTWRVDYGAARKGSLAGTSSRGYLRVKCGGATHYVHRICWMVKTGQEPPPIIDHADGDGGNNRWVNLRAATPSQNAFNTAHKRPRKTLPTGIIVNPSTGLYRAKITQDGSTWASPWYATVPEASAARLAKAREMYGEYYRRH